jgi:hypothetical protein
MNHAINAGSVQPARQGRMSRPGSCPDDRPNISRTTPRRHPPSEYHRKSEAAVKAGLRSAVCSTPECTSDGFSDLLQSGRAVRIGSAA